MRFLALLPLAFPSSGDLDATVERVLPRVVEWRRAVHAHPELGERETKTAALVASVLRELDLEVREGVAVTGVVGVLRGGRPGGVVAYRADMDALPVTERTGLPYASTRRETWAGQEVGVMHACGHDVHVAVALGVAAVLADPAVRAELPGTVVFLFQPAEEGLPGPEAHGAERMVQEGVLEDPRPEAIFGLHVDPTLAVGQVSLIPGGAMAAVDRFVVRVHGQQTHGAYPHEGVDPIVIASHVVLALQTIASREIDPRDPVVVTVGRFLAGNRYNIIPEVAELTGTIRTHSESVQAEVHARLRAIATGAAEALGGSAEVEIQGITPVTFNDPALVERMRPVAQASVGAGNVVEERPHLGGEDFAYFAREVPGLYYFLGTSDFSKGRPAMVHTPEFAPEEGSFVVGLRTSVRILLAALGE